MAMEPIPGGKRRPVKGGKRGERGDRGDREEGGERGPRFGNSRYTPKLLGKAYFQRKKGCPFSGPKAPKIDYKDVRLLQRYVSEYGKILPRHLTGVCAAKQRELATAIKRARILSLLPFSGRAEREPRPDRAPREGGNRYENRAPRENREPAASAPVAERSEQ